MKTTIVAAMLVATTTLQAHAAIPPAKANQISSAAHLVSLQSSNKATVKEAVNAVGRPSHVVESRHYRNISALKLAEGTAVTLIWSHEGCVLSLLNFDKNQRAVGAVTPGKNILGKQLLARLP